MNHYCCVPGCKSWVKRNPELSFHLFPKPKKSNVIVETKLGSKELVDRRKVWIQRLKIGKKVSDYMRVCSLHFEATDFLQKQRVKRRTLKLNAIPSQKLPLEAHSTEPGPSSRSITAAAKQRIVTTVAPSLIPCEDVEDLDDQEAAEILTSLKNTENSTLSKDAAVQVNITKEITLCDILDSDFKLKEFTGVDNYVIFNTIVPSSVLEMMRSLDG
uniref:Uncharacterized protein LOC114339901 isoform X3 n=1 Tax=Diabrotica virgifera virgifera TaxID=50390 RepID=A0A6P7GB51_DIAVI